MYFVPKVFGVHDFGKKVDQTDVNICCEMYGLRRTVCCQEFQGLAQLLKPDLHSPTTAHDAIELYRELLKLIDESME